MNMPMPMPTQSPTPTQIENGVEWSVQDGVARLTLNRPEKANAIDLPMALSLAKAIDELVAAQPRLIVIAARGPIFCAGGDIQSFVEAGPQFEQLVVDILSPLLPAYLKLAQVTCPVLSVVSGPLGGAGIGLGLVADVVIASHAMKLRTGYAAIGLSPDVGASYFLARRVGAMRAQRWLMLSSPITAQECLQAGAVDALYAPEELPQAAEDWTQRLLHLAPASIAAIKRLMASFGQLPLADHLALERNLLQACARTHDAQEGIAAFMAKRKPQFSGQ
jgi:2-(1,2-epoxy-1,2-dihydrophenyl)acetyl-CoA isomerase